MNPKKYFAFVDRLLRKFSSKSILILAVVCVVIISIPDYLAGLDISLSLFYILPIVIATWYAGKNAGFVIAFLSAVPLFLEQLNNNYLVNHQGIFFWNLFLQIGTTLTVVFLLDRLVAHAKNESNLARIDSVTGILNRRGFFEHLEFSLGLMAREEVKLALAYIDLDDFKAINDKEGHDEGDRVLRLVASTLEQSARQSDVIGRLGGDEFALLIHGVDQEQAPFFIEKIRLALKRAFETEKLMVTCSIGCVTFHALVIDINSAIKAADLLMYKVKREGKNGVVVEEFNPQLVNTNESTRTNEAFHSNSK